MDLGWRKAASMNNLRGCFDQAPSVSNLLELKHCCGAGAREQTLQVLLRSMARNARFARRHPLDEPWYLRSAQAAAR